MEEKLRESRESIVGLEYISEVIAVSNAEVEPYYECTSCGTQGEANGMYNHLVGKNHRERFIEKKFPDDPRYEQYFTNSQKIEVGAFLLKISKYLFVYVDWDFLTRDS